MFSNPRNGAYNIDQYISSIIMLSVNFFCNISSNDILVYITKNYIALIYYGTSTMPVSRGEGWVFSCPSSYIYS